MSALPVIEGYKTQKKIGQGATAEVYQAIQINLDREVALKVLKKGLEHDSNYATYAKRFIDEARTVSKLHHNNIVTIYNMGRCGNCHYIEMEYLGESLKDKLKNNGRLPEKEILRIFKQVARALKHAHSKKVVHRDIKPANILFKHDGSPVIVDFGLARVIDANTTWNLTKKITGTVFYMSPEQCKGERVDYLSDIYSLGVVLFEMLSGKVPYIHAEKKRILDMHIKNPIPRLPEEQRKFQPLIDQMMAKDKNERIHDLEKAVKQLKCLINGDDADTTGIIGNRRNEKTAQVIIVIIILMFFLVLLLLLKIKLFGKGDANDESMISNGLQSNMQVENNIHK